MCTCVTLQGTTPGLWARPLTRITPSYHTVHHEVKDECSDSSDVRNNAQQWRQLASDIKHDVRSDAGRFRCTEPARPGYVGVSPNPPLTGMDPEVGFEVGRLAVHLPTAGERAAVPLLGGFLPRRGVLVPGLFGCHQALTVPGVQPATSPLHLLQCAGVTGPDASAAPCADRTRVAFVQVQ